MAGVYLSEDVFMNFKNFDRKKIMFVIVVLLIVIFASIFMIYFINEYVKPDIDDDRPIPPDPSESIGSQVGSIIDVETETDGRAVPQGTDAIDYSDGKCLTQFTLIGLYNGTVFFDQKVDDRYKVVMQFSYNPNPYDGVIEGSFIPEIVDDKFVVSVYVDDDFRRNFPDANIIFGPYYENIQKFDYSKEIRKGIYMNRITDSNLERFYTGYEGPDANVYVGNANLENARNRELDGKYGFFLK